MLVVKKAFFENATGAFKLSFRRIYASYEAKMHMFQVVKDRESLLVVIRSLHDARIRFY